MLHFPENRSSIVLEWECMLCRRQAEREMDGYGTRCRAVMSFELKNWGFCDTMVIQKKIL